jgi:glucose/arabinose dehydrogenase
LRNLEMIFNDGVQFPADYKGDAFAAEHGSWNRSRRTGHKVIRVITRDGEATGEYDDFMTGFVTNSATCGGRPVGVTVGHDGSLL